MASSSSSTSSTADPAGSPEGTLAAPNLTPLASDEDPSLVLSNANVEKGASASISPCLPTMFIPRTFDMR